MAKLVKNFTRVKLLETKQTAEVIDFLDSMLTAETDLGQFLFLSYADKGVTWTPIEQTAEEKKKMRMSFISTSFHAEPFFEEFLANNQP